MVEQTATAKKDEQKIIAIMRHLPPERKAQMLAFARFLAFETFQTADPDFLEDAYTEADAKWDEMLASKEGQRVLEKLADEALAEIRAGKATEIVLTEEGEIAPE